MFGYGSANVLDGFSGIGGNAIQFAKKCGFCLSADLDLQKVEYTQHNAQVYNVDLSRELVVKHSDFLKLDKTELCQSIPQNRKQGFDTVFLSPPWGGTGYQMLETYSLDHLYPDFDSIMKKSLELSQNQIWFLPKNTSIDEIIDKVLPYHAQLLVPTRSENCTPNMQKKQELSLEIEQLNFGNACKVLLVCTGSLCRISPVELSQLFISKFCNHYGPASCSSAKSSEKSDQDQAYLRQLLNNIFNLNGYRHFIKYLSKQGQSKVSLQKAIKSMQKEYTQEEWHMIKKLHKFNANSSRKNSYIEEKVVSKHKNSMLSSNMSQNSRQSLPSIEEEKYHGSGVSHKLKSNLKFALGAHDEEHGMVKKNMSSMSVGTKSIQTWSRTSRTSSFSQCSSGGAHENKSENQQYSKPRKQKKMVHIHPNHHLKKLERNKMLDQ